MRGNQINNEPTAIGCQINCCFAQMLVGLVFTWLPCLVGGTGTWSLHCWSFHSFVTSYLFCVITGSGLRAIYMARARRAPGRSHKQVSNRTEVPNHEL